MQQALIDICAADAALSAIVQTRVHWVRLPETVKAVPYVILQLVDDGGDYHFGQGQSKHRESLVQADIYAETYPVCDDAGRAFEAALSAYRGTIGGSCIESIFVEGQRDFDASLSGGERQLFRRNIDLKIRWHKES